MADTADAGPPPPNVDTREPEEVAAGIFVIRDRRVPLVPNVGIVLGEESALVVDTGMGPVNGQRVLEAARRLAAGRRLILTLLAFPSGARLRGAGVQRPGPHHLQQGPAG